MKKAIIAAILSFAGASAFAGEIKLDQGSYCLGSSDNKSLGLISIKKDGTSSTVEILKASKESAQGCYTINFKFRDTGKEFDEASLCEYPGSC